MASVRSNSDWSLAKFDPSRVTDDLFASLDVAEVNLACAQGLPGAEDLDIAACLEKIDEWAEKVRHATSRNYNQFVRDPGRFDNSLGKFYMAVLSTTLWRDCGVCYSPERQVTPDDARDSRDQFIHGITHRAGGTCASLPVLYAAIGRRLGYPLRIVKGERHLFVRWDESEKDTSLVRDRFNIEATANGFVSEPDRYYEQWPFPHSDPNDYPRDYLRSFTPREELALFLVARAYVLMENGKFAQAIRPAAMARWLCPNNIAYRARLEMVMLLALGLLDERPAWVDETSIIGIDGVARKPHWWPQTMENAELLPAAKLPPDILARILPPDAPDYKKGDLADVLYERANHYADEECVERALQAAMTQRSSAQAVWLNTIQRARQREVMDAMTRNNVQVGPAGGFPQLPTTLPTAVRQALPLGHPLRLPRHEDFGGPHRNMGVPHQHGMRVPGAFDRHGFAPEHSMVPPLPDAHAMSDAHFAMTHGIFPMLEEGSLFEYMGAPKELVYQPQFARAISQE